MTEAEIAALESAGLGGPTGPYSLKAPFDGEVLELHAVTGEQVEIGSQLVLFGDTRTLWVWVDLYESHLAQVSRVGAQGGLPAAVSVRAYQGEIFPGRVDFIGRTMDEATRTVKARVTLENPEGKLRPGMFARVRLEVGEDRHALAVPAAAVLSDEGRDFVFVQHEDDFYVRRPVKQGRRSEEFAEILSGLEPGQTIVVEGAFLLKSDVLRSKMGAGCAH
jgi:cobalt-zinc-cadmium efflux system membrane fusion protein